MRQFFTEYSGSEFLEQVVPELAKIRRQISAKPMLAIVSFKASNARRSRLGVNHVAKK